MKKYIIGYAIVSFIIYFSGGSPGARYYVENLHGWRYDSFISPSSYAIHEDEIYISGILLIRDKLGKEYGQRDATLTMHVKGGDDYWPQAISDGPPPNEANPLDVVETDDGMHTTLIATAATRPNQVYAVYNSGSFTHFIIDTRNREEPKIVGIGYHSERYRSRLSENRIWIGIAHIIDMITAPFQLLYILFASFLSPMSGWK